MTRTVTRSHQPTAGMHTAVSSVVLSKPVSVKTRAHRRARPQRLANKYDRDERSLSLAREAF